MTRELLIAATARLIGADAAATDRFGIAVSGGPDSMALLTLAADAFAGRIAAATVDHMLRPDSGTEAAMVARHCAELDVTHTVLSPATPITGSLQAAARTVRYALLETWRQQAKLDWLMTAHHADDQLETVVMRLNRASGLAGLSGVRERQGRVLRPLLGVRRATLHAVVTAHAIVCANDPSNADPRFDRVRVRSDLAHSDLLDALAVATSARHLAQDEAALGWAVDRLAVDRITNREDKCIIDMAGLPPGIRRRLLIAGLALCNEPAPRGDTLDRAAQDVLNGISVMIGNSIIDADGAVWTVRRAPARRMH